MPRVLILFQVREAEEIHFSGERFSGLRCRAACSRFTLAAPLDILTVLTLKKTKRLHSRCLGHHDTKSGCEA